jgi:outer membrane protein TolC
MKTFAVVLILAATLPAAVAQTNATRPLSLQDCLQESLKHNFDVQVERIQPQISLYDLYSAYSGYDPQLNISGKHSFNVSPSTRNPYSTNQVPASVSDENSFNSGIGGTLPWGLQYDFSGSLSEQYGSLAGSPFDNSSGDIGVTLTQPLLKNFWTDNTRLLIVAAKNNLKQSEQGLRQQLITTVSAVENAYYELIYARENLTVQQQALTLAQTQLDQDRQRMQIGTLAQLSVEQDESQVAQNQANVITAEFTLAQDQNTLKNLLTDHYADWHDTDIVPTASLEAVQQLFDLQDSWNKGMTQRPDLLQAQLTLEQQGIQLKFDHNQTFPELDLVGSYGFNGAGKEFSDTLGQINNGNAPFYTYGAQLSVPLSNAKARNAYKVDKAVEQQDLLKLKQLEQNIMVQIDNAVKQAQSAWESVDATKQARIYAEAALDAEQKTYAVGKATTFEVLQYQNSLTTARSQEIRALANYEEALANLAQQEGSTLERRNLDIEVK